MECTRVTIHKDLSVSDREQELLKDSLNLHTPSFYKGTAYFKNGDSTEVSVIYAIPGKLVFYSSTRWYVLRLAVSSSQMTQAFI